MSLQGKILKQDISKIAIKINALRLSVSDLMLFNLSIYSKKYTYEIAWGED